MAILETSGLSLRRISVRWAISEVPAMASPGCERLATNSTPIGSALAARTAEWTRVRC
jgi:hypothetical protein